MLVTIKKPNSSLLSAVMSEYPLKFVTYTHDDKLLLSCTTITQDPYTGKTTLVLNSEYTKIFLTFSMFDCESVQKGAHL